MDKNSIDINNFISEYNSIIYKYIDKCCIILDMSQLPSMNDFKKVNPTPFELRPP